ncbi:MAG: L,D-transpeptidase [Pseudomonadota bacterium]
MKTTLLTCATVIGAIACSQQLPATAETSAPQLATAAETSVPRLSAQATDTIQSVNAADFSATAATTARSFDPAVLRLQVLLDRAHFSPGSIDGLAGGNLRKAVAAYGAAHGVAGDAAVLQALIQSDTAPALVSYTIDATDVAGPFVRIPRDLQAQSRLHSLGYANAQEALGEKFHMDPRLLRALNPGASFAAGTEIVVAGAGGDLDTQVASIEVDKTLGDVRALDAQGAVLAFYPATIGSGEHPAPTGAFAVRGVAFNPIYHFDPARLPAFNRADSATFDVAAGPNNPVGLVWIALTADTYGIHGSPDPEHIGKTESHGCVRLTNWDAMELGHAVRPGVPVTFIEATAQAAASHPG